MSVIDRLRCKMDILSIKKYSLFVARAATAIYLILCDIQKKNIKVLVPANICYAAIYPIVYSGNIPVFCDVDSNTGNVSLKEVEKYLNLVQVMIIPHMFGNPVSEMDKIADICKKHNIILIEDCASAMGAKLYSNYCGTWGDYAVFSTGYSKTIDIGCGGIVISDRRLESLKEHYQKLPLKTVYDKENEAFFSKMYRVIRNNKQQTLDRYIWRGLYDNLRSVFIHRVNHMEQRIKEEIVRLPDIIKARKREWQYYDQFLRKSSFFDVYTYMDDGVPWRFNLLVQQEEKDPFVQYLLEKKVPVSDWYPVVVTLFGEENVYENATLLENRIINFPLLIGENKIREICGVVNDYRN